MALDNKPSEWVAQLKHGGSLPLLDFQHCSHGWASPPGDIFLVRGPDYLETKSKTRGGQWLLCPIAFDWIKSSSKISNIMKHPSSRVRAALAEARKHVLRHSSGGGSDDSSAAACAVSDVGSRPFVWAFNLQLSNKDNHSIIMYFVSFDRPKKGSLVQRFIDGDDEFRNSRLKLLCHVTEGPRIVKAAVGNKGAACIIGRKLTCTYIREECYMEVDIDVGSSMAAQVVTKLALGAVAMLTVDIAFVLEGTTSLELPERILGAVRFANLNLSHATYLDSITNHNDLKAAFSSNKLWRSFMSKLLPSGHLDPIVNVEDDGGEDDDGDDH